MIQIFNTNHENLLFESSFIGTGAVKLTKLNAEAYAQKTNVGAFLFLNSRTGDYVLVDVDNLEDSIDDGLFGTAVKNNVSGYQWNNPHPQMIIR